MKPDNCQTLARMKLYQAFFDSKNYQIVNITHCNLLDCKLIYRLDQHWRGMAPTEMEHLGKRSYHWPRNTRGPACKIDLNLAGAACKQLSDLAWPDLSVIPTPELW